MIKKTILVIAVFTVALNASLMSAINYQDVGQADSKYGKSERKELTPEEKECINDLKNFIFYYEVIAHMHRRFEEESGVPVPASVRRELEEADRVYSAMKRHFGGSRRFASYAVGLWGNAWTFGYCKEMYNKEMNDMFGTHFSPTSNDPFLDSNYFCNTAYKDALRKMKQLLYKYDSGQHKCRD